MKEYFIKSPLKRRWSKLQREIYKLIVPDLNLQIHCVAYPMKSGATMLPRYWITLDKEIIFDYPSDFMNLEETRSRYPFGDYKKGNVSFNQVSEISDIIRDYIDIPKDQLLDYSDKYRISDILKAADRRIGKDKLFSAELNDVGIKVLLKRFNT